MKIITLDFETYYSATYSLTKITTEEYVRSHEFQVIGISIKQDDAPAVWFPRPEVQDAIASIDWSDAMVVAQNTAFDGAILKWKYGVNPKLWADTLGMSRALFPHEKSHSLAAQTARAGIGNKGDEVLRAIGKRYEDFTPEELVKYGEYCCNDTELTYKLFSGYLTKGFAKNEIKLIDLTLRLFIDPVLHLDGAMLKAHLVEVRERKETLLDTVRDLMLAGADPEFVHAIFTEGSAGIKKLLMSNVKFAEVLVKLGVVPPMKVSPATGKQAFAFAKSDPGMKQLEEHPNDMVQALVAARLGNKSTLEETRTERFIGMAMRGEFPVPLRYYGAHSGRWSGQDKVNLQNLPARGPNAGKIKKSVLPPEGYVFIDCDSAQIEARTLAWMAGQQDLVEAFRNKEDVYRLMASSIYKVSPAEVTGPQRQVGKVVILGCFGPDTLVLTGRGWIPIIQVRGMDTVWDGISWVQHQGLAHRGEQEVQTQHGISATLDHEIWTEHGWQEWSAVCENPRLFQSALKLGSLSSLVGAAKSLREGELSGGNPSVDVPVAGKGWFTATICKLVGLLGATSAPKLKPILKDIGPTSLYVRMKVYAQGCLTVFPPVWRGAVTLLTNTINTTERVGYWYTPSGLPTVRRFYDIYLAYRDMKIPRWNWIVSMSMMGINRETYGLCQGRSTWVTGEKLETCKPEYISSKSKMQTYDLTYTGPHNRYTVLTDKGPILVHNCGYGVGATKLRITLKAMAGVEVTDAEAKRIVDTYRATYSMIPKLWTKAQEGLVALTQGTRHVIDVPGICVTDATGITLPSGLHIQYPSLGKVLTNNRQEWSYMSKGLPMRIYGGAIIENVCQGVARCIIGEQMLRVSRKLRVVMTVHDSIGVIAPVNNVDAARQYLEDCMQWTPKWAEGLPLGCESGVGKSYGDC